MRRQFPLFIDRDRAWPAPVARATTGGASAAERERVREPRAVRPRQLLPAASWTWGRRPTSTRCRPRSARARPAIGECLADAQGAEPGGGHQGQGDHRHGRLGDHDHRHADGLKPAAVSCIEKADPHPARRASRSPPTPSPSPSTAPIERDPASMVRMGVNESSDVVGAIRLALPQWCCCFDSLRTQAPPELAGSVTVIRPDVTQYADRLRPPTAAILEQGSGAARRSTATEPSGARRRPAA